MLFFYYINIDNTLINIEKIIFEKWKDLDESKRQDYYLRSQQEQDQYPLTVTQWKYELYFLKLHFYLVFCLHDYIVLKYKEEF